MNIISYFKEILLKNIKESLDLNVNEILKALSSTPYSINLYTTFVENIDDSVTNIGIKFYEHMILLIDEQFMQSPIRKQLYDSKGFVTKTLLTKFGYLQFKRRRYVNIKTRESYMHVDTVLGLEKYSTVDPLVIADLCEEAAENSYAKAGRIVSKTIGNKIKYDDEPNKNLFSRARVRNLCIKAIDRLEEPKNDLYNEIDEINIMVDEKFVSSQNNKDKDHMIKAAVVFESYRTEYKGRRRLVNKKTFGSLDNDLLLQVMDYIYYNYDTDKLKRVNIMGDGANWVKGFAFDSSLKYHKDLIVKFGLDHFHLSQALMNLTTRKYKDIYDLLLKYIIDNKKEEFLEVVEAFILKEPTREKTITEKRDYIINNWKHIQTSYKDITYKCSMEAHISHIFADLFTSRPKGYSEEGLKRLLKLRLLKKNGHDIKKLYLSSFDRIKKEKMKEEIENKLLIKNKVYNDLLYNSVPIMHRSNATGSILNKIINGKVNV